MSTHICHLTIIFAAAFAACAVAPPAHARKIPFQTAEQLEKKCGDLGGTYAGPGRGGVYSCQLLGGDIVGCGGAGADAQTCESYEAHRTILHPLLIRSGKGERTGALPCAIKDRCKTSLDESVPAFE